MHFKCYFCGGALGWNSDFNASDVCTDYADDDPAVCSYYTFQRCGRSYEIIEPSQEEQQQLWNDYWNHH